MLEYKYRVEKLGNVHHLCAEILFSLYNSYFSLNVLLTSLKTKKLTLRIMLKTHFENI